MFFFKYSQYIRDKNSIKLQTKVQGLFEISARYCHCHFGTNQSEGMWVHDNLPSLSSNTCCLFSDFLPKGRVTDNLGNPIDGAFSRLWLFVLLSEVCPIPTVCFPCTQLLFLVTGLSGPGDSGVLQRTCIVSRIIGCHMCQYVIIF